MRRKKSVIQLLAIYYSQFLLSSKVNSLFIRKSRDAYVTFNSSKKLGSPVSVGIRVACLKTHRCDLSSPAYYWTGPTCLLAYAYQSKGAEQARAGTHVPGSCRACLPAGAKVSVAELVVNPLVDHTRSCIRSDTLGPVEVYGPGHARCVRI